MRYGDDGVVDVGDACECRAASCRREVSRRCSGVGCTTSSTGIQLETEGSRRFFGDISAARSVSDAEWSTTSDAGFVAAVVAVSAADLTLLL